MGVSIPFFFSTAAPAGSHELRFQCGGTDDCYPARARVHPPPPACGASAKALSRRPVGANGRQSNDRKQLFLREALLKCFTKTNRFVKHATGDERVRRTRGCVWLRAAVRVQIRGSRRPFSLDLPVRNDVQCVQRDRCGRFSFDEVDSPVEHCPPKSKATSASSDVPKASLTSAGRKQTGGSAIRA